MLRLPFLVALALVLAFGLGTVSTIRALQSTVGFGAISLGPWVAYPQSQTADADPYARAHRARTGRLLYGTAEGLRFTAATDSSGAPLSLTCRYDIAGRTPPARFWTLYAADLGDVALKPGPGLPAAINAWTVQRKADSSFVVHVAQRAERDNWLAVPNSGSGAFTLVLTLLDTPTAGSSGVIDLAMPQIVRTGCPDA